MADPHEPERHFNIHIEPDQMGGVYANFASVGQSDYEFTITFARIDYEAEDDANVPGVVVARVNLSHRCMGELLAAMQDSFARWQARESIKSLPEVDRPGDGEDF